MAHIQPSPRSPNSSLVLKPQIMSALRSEPPLGPSLSQRYFSSCLRNEQRQFSFLSHTFRTSTLALASSSMPKYPDWLLSELGSSSTMTDINWPLII